MPTTLKFRRGTDVQNSVFVGAESEITYDTVRQTIRVHDGTTAGGKTLATREWVTSVFPIGRYEGDVLGSIYADDSTLMIDAVAGKIVGRIDSPSIRGDLTGSVYAKDSTLLVNADSGTIPGSVISGAVATATLATAANKASQITLQYAPGQTAQRYIPYVTAQAGDSIVYTDDSLRYQPSTDTLTVGTVRADLRGSVFADDSTVLVNADDGFIPAAAVRGTFSGEHVGSVFGDDSTVLVDGPNSVLRGTHIGTLTGVASQSNETYIINQPDATFRMHVAFTNNFNGYGQVRVDQNDFRYQPSSNTLFVRNIQGDLKGSVVGDDSTVIIDGVSGTLRGQLFGDVYGSVFADDSTMLINADDGYVSGEVRNSLVVTQTIQDLLPVPTSTIDLGSGIALTSTGGVTLDGAAGATVRVGTQGTTGDVYIGKTGNSVYVSGTLRANITGNVKGTLAGDDSTVLIDGLQSKIVGPVESQTVISTVYTQTAVYADSAARDSAITAPQPGMIVFLTNLLKFTGYTGSGWQDLN